MPLSRYAFALLTAIPVLAAVTVPSGTEVSVRLSTLVSTESSKAGQPIEAVVIAPVVEGERILIGAGARLFGEVAEVKPAATPSERAELHFRFSEMAGKSGKRRPIKASVVNVDNARESVNEAGRILGILASETLAARAEQGISKVAQKNSGLADLLSLAKGAVLQQKPTGEIRYEPGVELKLKLTESLIWDEAESAPPLRAISDEAALYDLVNSQPFQTVAENPPKPSDITNLMFVGTEQQLREAFKEAGWTGAHQLNQQSVLETVRAIAELRGYKEAPMSRLLLEGKGSDMDFQKQNNTFAKRHHLRIWKRPVSFEGKPVWVCSSTHDIGIEFSPENRTFIHVIDPHIDRERAKIVSDLLFTNRVDSLALVDRPGVPRETRNATGDSIRTDGRMAVVILR